MEQNNLDSMRMLDIPNPSSIAASSKNMMPQLEMEKKAKLQKIFTALTLLLLLVALIWLALTLFYLFKLQQDITNLEQANISVIQVAEQISEVQSTTNLLKDAAHLTGKAFTEGSKTLMWEDIKGYGFTRGIRYRDRGLIIRESGLFFIYSKIFFRGSNCVRGRFLEQIVFKRTDRFPKDIALMNIKKSNYCSMNSSPWHENTYQAGIFQLVKGDYISVNVSHPDLVNFSDPYTFFGLYQF